MNRLRKAVAVIKLRLEGLISRMSSESHRASNAFYSQQASCQIPYLWSLLAQYLGERQHGTFVEVGAYDGVSVSNTWGLALRGWEGLLIEPVPSLAAACRSNHSAHSGIRVVESAVGDTDDGVLELQQGGPLTSANKALVREYQNVGWAAPTLTSSCITVPLRTLNSLLNEYGIGVGFDLLIVDVEGFEKEVFAGFNLEWWSPKMLIVELVDTHPDLTTTANSDAILGEQIMQSGYRVVYKDVINTVFVRFDVWTDRHAM